MPLIWPVNTPPPWSSPGGAMDLGASTISQRVIRTGIGCTGADVPASRFGARTVTSVPSLIAGCSAGFVLVRIGIRSNRLATIGVFSFTIYLFHTFATSATRIGLERVGLDVLAVHLALGVVAGIAAPMVVDVIARRRAWSRRALLGRSRADLP